MKPGRVAIRILSYLAATLVGLISLFLLSTLWATRHNNHWWLGGHDPLFEINNRAILAIGGTFHLAAAAYLVSSQHALNRSLVILWAGLNHLIYYAGIRLLAPPALMNTESFLGWRLRRESPIVDLQWKLLTAVLIVAGVVSLALIWRDSKALTKNAWLLEWQGRRSQYKENVALKKRCSAESYSKIVCSHCGQKIAFPLSRLGEKIACPNCAARIALQEMPGRMT